MGWTDWVHEEHETLRAAVMRCDVRAASASSAADAATILDLVVERFHSADAASTAVRDAIIRGFYAASSAAFVPLAGSGDRAGGQETEDPTAKKRAIEQLGIRPHADPRIPEVWAPRGHAGNE